MDRKRFTLEIPWPNISPVRLARRLTGWLPTRGNVIFTLAMIVLLIAAQSAGALPLGRPQAAPAAASTGTIAYQGRLADAAGAPLTGTYNMIFRLYDAATGGTPLWSEPWTGSNGVKVSDGLFNVMLGSLSQLPISQFTNSSSLFLGITVGTDDEMAPRVQLGSVPFAVQALTVPDGSVTTAMIADGAVTAAKLATGTVGGQTIEGAFTRDLASASGDQLIAGLGFQPRSLIVMFLLNGSSNHGQGFASGPLNQNVLYQNGADSKYYAYFGEGNALIEVVPSVGNSYSGKLKSFDADGFTITWTQNGSPTGTLWVKYIAYK